MPDIADLILDEHDIFRRRFAELDDKRAADAPAEDLDRLWQPLANLLERHASAEEELFYPRLLKKGDNARDETEDAISDHNDIRAAIARARHQSPGEESWWEAVLGAREANSDHMAEEEREALADFRQNASEKDRQELGERWLSFSEDHAGARGLDLSQPDPQDYIEEHD